MIDKNLFTLEAYRNLLQTAKHAGYRFLAFSNPKRFVYKKVCLLRHDIDVDLGAALETAKIEADLRIRATYFLMLRSPVYNLMSRDNTRLVQEIMELGHWLGLHYDEGFYPDSHHSHEEWVGLKLLF